MSPRHVAVFAMAAVTLGVIAWLALSGRADGPPDELTTTAGPATTVTSPTASETTSSTATELTTTDAAAPPPTTFPAVLDSAIADLEDRTEVVELEMQVIATVDHQTDAFTQGLEFVGDRLFESTGLVNQSSLREIDPDTGEVLRIVAPPGEVFAEGVTEVDGSLIQLTWRDGVAIRWDLDDFSIVDTYTYDGEGWGVCDDGERLVMSDGTSTLTFRDRSTFDPIGTVSVTFRGAPIDQINELECVGELVWANLWRSDLIVAIDPTDGRVVSLLNAGALRPDSTLDDGAAVLNGIAWDPMTQTFLLTGKRWPVAYRVGLSPIG